MYACATCGYRSPKWMGFCPQCRGAEALVEQAAATSRRVAAPSPLPLRLVGETAVARRSTGLEEVDRVLGGGLVAGAAVLVGGEPGVGKSTLLLQMAGSLAAQGSTVLVASAEESAEQVGLRAQRLGLDAEGVYLLAEDDIDAILAAAEELHPYLLVVDSVQAIAAGEVDGSAGGVAQVRECAARVIRFAKERGTAAVLVGHVTKNGGIAGPKLLEHMVDVVAYLEGEADRGVRLLRSLKNRFGATHRVGLFEMRDEGLTELHDPSVAFVSGWQGAVAGTVLFPTVEGRRPVLVELQALVAPGTTPQPRRSVRGLESARLHQLLAVLERHAGLRFSGRDVYLAVVGGFRIDEPAADLPVAFALASSLLDRPLGPVAAWGEVGLTGELRPAAQEERRREEASRVGAEVVIAPRTGERVRIVDALGAVGLLP